MGVQVNVGQSVDATKALADATHGDDRTRVGHELPIRLSGVDPIRRGTAKYGHGS